MVTLHPIKLPKKANHLMNFVRQKRPEERTWEAMGLSQSHHQLPKQDPALGRSPVCSHSDTAGWEKSQDSVDKKFGNGGESEHVGILGNARNI